MAVVVCAMAAAQSAPAGVTSGLLLTSFASATYSYPSGLGATATSPGLDANGYALSATSWGLVTDQPQLCMKSWKVPTDLAGAPLAGSYSGSAVVYTVGFSNCGSFSGFSVKITDILPGNVVRGASLPGEIWVKGGGSPVFVGWATSMAGPWLQTTPEGQVAPHYIRWILDRVGMHKTGYVRYVVTIL